MSLLSRLSRRTSQDPPASTAHSLLAPSALAQSLGGALESHSACCWRVLSGRRAVRFAAVLLAMVALTAVFAEFLCADTPLLEYSQGQVRVFPALVGSPKAAPSAVPSANSETLRIWPLVRFGPHQKTAAGPLAAPCRRHPLGTDSASRDVFARLIYGARSALSLALLAMMLSLLLGVSVGCFAGYLGGAFDELLSRPIEVIQAFPVLLVVAIAQVVFPRGSVFVLAVCVAALKWAEVARLVRFEVARVTAGPWVQAALALGCPHWRVLWRHVLPSALGPVLVSLSFALPSLVLFESMVGALSLSSAPSWGALIAEVGSAPVGALAASLLLGTTAAAGWVLALSLRAQIDVRIDDPLVG